MRMLVSIGSNIDPARYVPRAVQALRARFSVLAVSPVYETAPVGDANQADFWNLVALIESDEPAADVQHALHEIEDSLGRTRDPARRFGPRTADLDLVLVEGEAGTFDSFVLPSPLVASEPFVAVPAADVAPDLLHPTLGVTLADVARTVLALSDARPRRVAVEIPT